MHSVSHLEHISTHFRRKDRQLRIDDSFRSAFRTLKINLELLWSPGVHFFPTNMGIDCWGLMVEMLCCFRSQYLCLCDGGDRLRVQEARTK